jgi:arylsulfatase A-like enzyme
MSDRPNILFFFTDDQRFDTIRALGNGQVITPNLDSLVENGTSFTNAYIMGGSCPAVCMPSRAMLMTGRTLYHIEGQGQSVPEGHALMGETLRGSGYETFGTGKWHSGPRAYARSFSAGGEIFFGGMDDHWNVPANDFDPRGEYRQRIQQTVDFHSQRIATKICDHITAGKHSSELFADATIDFLRGLEGDDPFFAYVSFMAPHDPRTMPQEYMDMYDPAEIELPPNFMAEHPFDNGELKIRDEVLAGFPRTEEEVKQHIAAYYAMITHADAQMGRVLEVLRETGRGENTIVVFAGDNGLAVGRHGLMGKQNMYEHSVHVPLMMCGPGVPQGERREALAYLIDIFPTLCDLTGVEIPGSVEGKSLAPALRDADERIREHLHFAYRHWQRSVRDERHKLIEYAVDGVRTTQLFDLVADPHELNDLSGEAGCAEKLEELRRALRLWQEEYGDVREGQGEVFWGAYDGEG